MVSCVWSTYTNCGCTSLIHTELRKGWVPMKLTASRAFHSSDGRRGCTLATLVQVQLYSMIWHIVKLEYERDLSTVRWKSCHRFGSRQAFCVGHRLGGWRIRQPFDPLAPESQCRATESHCLGTSGSDLFGTTINSSYFCCSLLSPGGWP